MTTTTTCCECCGALLAQMIDLVQHPPRRLCLDCYGAGCDGRAPCQR